MSFSILHVLDHSIPLHSGYSFRTRSILNEQRRIGWKTFHLTSPKHTAPSAPEETVDGLHFYRTAALAGPLGRVPVVRELALMRATRRRLEVVARAVRPDVLHAHSPVLNAWPAIVVGRMLDIPVVYEVRAFWEDAAVDAGTAREGGARYRATRALETRALHRVDRVTTICEGLRRDIVGRGIAADRVTVIPNAVDPASFAPAGAADPELQASLGLAGRTVLGFIGSFYPYEGLDLLLAALPRIVAAQPDVRVLLVGGGSEEAELRAQAAALGLADRIVFAGRVPHERVQRYYDLVDVLVYPRHRMRLTELVTPLKPLEAMAQGKMLVASDVGGHRELIRDGVTGTLFPAGDAQALAAAITGLLERRHEWPRLRDAARHYVLQERTWAASVEAYRRVYGALVARHDVQSVDGARGHAS